LWDLVYPQIWYYFLIPELFFDGRYILQFSAILLCYIISIVDTYFRPFSENIREDWSKNPVYNVVILGLFLLNPLFVVGAFYEKERIILNFFPIWSSEIITFFGLILLFIGGIIGVTGRIQLSRFGSGVLQIEEDHELVTSGIFSVIRHPIYSGGMIGVLGLFIAFNSVFMMLGVSALYFGVMRHRLIFEEDMLVEEFGDEYRDYMKKTKRLIPYLY
jgi:protein-S-isoprenylcysteine O-methyltransferase Ste14